MLIIATHLATLLLYGLCSPKNVIKHALVDALFLYFQKYNIGHLLRTPWDYLRSPSFKKEIYYIFNIFIIFLCTFSKINC